MEAWTKALDDGDGGDVYNFHEVFKIEDKGSELYRGRAEMMEHPTQNFVTHSDVQDMIAAELER